MPCSGQFSMSVVEGGMSGALDGEPKVSQFESLVSFIQQQVIS